MMSRQRARSISRNGRVVVDARVVDEHVDALDTLDGARNGVVHLGLVADVAGQVPRGAAVALDRRDGVLEVGFAAPQHEHVGALGARTHGRWPGRCRGHRP